MRDFADYLTAWQSAYRQVLRRYIVLRLKGGWRVLAAEFVYVSTGLPADFETVSIRTDSVIAGRDTIPMDRFKSDQDPSDLRLLLSDLDLHPCYLGESPLTDLFGTFHSRFNPRLPGPLRIPTLVHEGESVSELIKQSRDHLDLELLTQDEPYDGLAEIPLLVGIPPEVLTDNFLCRAEFSLFPVVNFSPESKLEGNRAILRLTCSESLNLSKLKVAYRAFRRDKLPVRGKLDLREFAKYHHENTIGLELQVEIQGSVFCDVFLTYDGEHIGVHRIADKMTSLSLVKDVARVFDPEWSFAANPGQGKQDAFERAVALLLQLQGLEVLHYGGIKGFQDDVDIVAFSSDGFFYIVECSSGDVDNKGKLQKLYDRSQKWQEALRGIKSPIQGVVSVLVTNLPRDRTYEHWDKARNLGLSLLCQEEIQELVAERSYFPTTRQLFDFVVGCMPPPKSSLELE